MYKKIIGNDQKEYGPVSGAQIRAWLREGRVNAQTKVQSAAGGEWQPLSAIPEFTEDLRAVTTPRTCEMAIASLVLGIFGLCGGITGLVGLPLGIVALSKIKKSDGALTGKNLAIVGLSTSGFFLVFTIAILLPALCKARGQAHAIKCLSGMKQLAYSARDAATHLNGKLPPAATWCDAIEKEVGAPYLFQCESTKDQRCSYALNSKLAGKRISDINPRAVLFFESDAGWNASGGMELMVRRPRHHEVFNVVFVDGSGQQVRPENLADLRWEP